MALNPLKQFNYVIEIEGLPAFVAQEVTTPAMNIAKVEHTEGNVVVNTPGRVSYGDFTLSMLKVAPGADQWAYDWFNSILNGVGQTLRNIIIRLQDEQFKSRVVIECESCFPIKLGEIALSAGADENVMEEVQFAVNNVKSRNI